jgi:hypothetical protein
VGLGVGLAAYGAAITAMAIKSAYLTTIEAIRAGTVLTSIAGFLGLNVAMLPFIAIAAAVVIGMTALYMIFKKLGGDTQMIGDGFRWLWSYMEEFGQNLVLLYYKIMDKITPGDKYKDLAEEQENKILATKKERDNLEKNMSERRQANLAEAAKKEKKADDTKNALDLKNIKEGQKNAAGLEANNKKQAEEQQKKLDLNANENDLLLQFAEQQGSAYIKDKPAASAAASTGTAAITTEADQKKAAAEAAAKKEEEAKAKAETSKSSSGSPTSPAQESPATLLASLNTKMDQLIKHAAVTQSNTYETFNATKGLSGNLFKTV